MSESLQNLAKTCNLTGITSVFIGAVVFYLDYMNRDYFHATAGVFIFIVGYANVKIANKLKQM